MSNPFQKESPELLARYFRFFRQEFTKRDCDEIISIKRTRSSGFYAKNKKIFDKLFEICKKYGIDYVKYIGFCVHSSGAVTPGDLIKISSFKSYGEDLRIKYKYRKIYDNYRRSAEWLAERTIQLGYSSSLQTLKDIIKGNRLAYEFISGRLSKYFIASIGNFDKIFHKLDLQNQNELGIIVDVSGELNDDVQKAFRMFLNEEVNPIKFTDEIIKNKKQKTQ